MRKRATVHLAFGIGFFVLVTLFKGWFSLVYLPFWVGALVGVFLPDIDHLIYVYALKPHELTSQRVSRMVENGRPRDVLRVLAATGGEREKLVFHAALFQIIFLVFAFLVVSSSGSLLGRGIVLGFLLHLLIDQLRDFKEKNTIDHWFHNVNLRPTQEQAKIYLAAHSLALFVFAVIF